MAKKKSKKKHRREQEAAELPIVAHEMATAISPTALATFSRDLAAFGSRAEKHASVGQATSVAGSAGQQPLV